MAAGRRKLESEMKVYTKICEESRRKVFRNDSNASFRGGIHMELVVEKYLDGKPASTWFALMPWASCSITTGLVEL